MLYIVRHGDAEDGSGKSDFDRELTAKGIEKLNVAVKGWKSIIDNIDLVISSPLIRAKQTAEIIGVEFTKDVPIQFDGRLGTGARPEDVIEVINAAEKESIAIVGHQPDLSYLLSFLISNSGATVDFGKGAIAGVSYKGKAKEGRGYLEFLVPIEVFV
jgi:phosphohistidine phosphatase